MAWKLFFLFLSCVSVMMALSEASCRVSNSCKNICMGMRIDLSEIVKPGTVLNYTDDKGNPYSFVFNLCSGSPCVAAPNTVLNAAVCEWKGDGSASYNFGKVSAATWSGSNSTCPFSFNVTYSGSTYGDGITRQAVLQFVHGDNKDAKIEFVEEIDNGNIHNCYFVITAKLHYWPHIHIHIDPVEWALLAISMLSFVILIVSIVLLLWYLKHKHKIGKRKQGVYYEKVADDINTKVGVL